MKHLKDFPKLNENKEMKSFSKENKKLYSDKNTNNISYITRYNQNNKPIDTIVRIGGKYICIIKSKDIESFHEKLQHLIYKYDITAYKTGKGMNINDIEKSFENFNDTDDIENNNYPEESETEELRPEENDCFIQSNGFKNTVSCGGKFIGEFVEDEDAEEAVKDWMKKNNWYPNVWFVDDHGGVSLYTMSHSK